MSVKKVGSFDMMEMALDEVIDWRSYTEKVLARELSGDESNELCKGE